jgi:hypothetical protein
MKTISLKLSTFIYRGSKANPSIRIAEVEYTN